MIRGRFLFFSLVAGMIATVSAPARGQAEPVAAVLLAVFKDAATTKVDTRNRHRVGFDQRVKKGPQRELVILTSTNRAAIDQVGPVLTSDVIRCGRTPRECSLDGVDAVVSFEVSDLSASKATVISVIHQNSGIAKQPVGLIVYRYEMAKTNKGAWEIRKVELVGQS